MSEKRNKTQNYTYLLDALVLQGSLNDFYRLIIAISENYHDFVVKSVYVNPLMSLFVSFNVWYVI